MHMENITQLFPPFDLHTIGSELRNRLVEFAVYRCMNGQIGKPKPWIHLWKERMTQKVYDISEHHFTMM